MKKEEIQEKCELCGLISLFLMSLLAVAPAARAGDNHVHIDQVGTGGDEVTLTIDQDCLLYTSPSPRDRTRSRMPSSA